MNNEITQEIEDILLDKEVLTHLESLESENKSKKFTNRDGS